MQSIITIQKQERDIIKKGFTQSKFNDKTRCICEQYDFYLYEDHPFKRSRYQEEKDEDLVITGGNIKFKGKFPYVVQRVCQELDAKDREFFVSYNRKVNHNESTNRIGVPTNFWALFKEKSPTTRS